MAMGPWYVAQDGEVVGPLTPSELAVLAATRSTPILVWADGLDGWVDAGEVESLRQILARPTSDKSGADALDQQPRLQKASLKDRARKELIEYAAISGYLYICFGALTLYKAAILRGEGISVALFGFAVAKALILGKFLLLLRAAKIGQHKVGPGRMALDIGRNALLFATLLVILAVIEEIVVGWFHGKAPAVVIAEMTGHSGLQVLATTLLMVLVLVPYFAFEEITERLGEGALLRMLLQRQERPKH
ncbi:MAG: DUF4339 domain-containing protein [Alsobacter sp.]